MGELVKSLALMSPKTSKRCGIHNYIIKICPCQNSTYTIHTHTIHTHTTHTHTNSRTQPQVFRQAPYKYDGLINIQALKVVDRNVCFIVDYRVNVFHQYRAVSSNRTLEK